MVANNGDNEGLFRGAFMESGSPIPVGPVRIILLLHLHVLNNLALDRERPEVCVDLCLFDLPTN
jgi:hypothetical protein